MTPIAKGLMFDPKFYRSYYDIRSSDPIELYRHWLDIGYDAGHAPNEDCVVFPYIGNGTYPAAFDWQAFARVADSCDYRAKIAALHDLFEGNHASRRRSTISQTGSANLFLKIGDYHQIRGRYKEALQHYSHACDSADDVGPAAFHMRGDALRELGCEQEAIASYQQALAFSSHNIWSLIHATKLSLKAGNREAAFERLIEGRAKWAGNPAYRRSVDEHIRAEYEFISSHMRRLLRNEALAEAHAFGDRELALLTSRIKALKFGDQVRITASSKKIVMLACLDLPQCKHYRVDQKIEQLSQFGIELTVFDFNDPDAFMTALPGASCALFYRVPCYPKIVEAILYAQSLSILTAYDLDDLLFSDDFPDTFESYEGQISASQYEGLRHGVPLYRHAISLCDIAIASTAALAAEMGPLTRSKRAYVVANGLDSTNEVGIAMGARRRPPQHRVTIFYGSGTRAHNRDFNELVGGSLRTLMETFPEVHLVLVGYLALDDFAEFEHRILRLPFINDRQQYTAVLAASDINISVLHSGKIADCKSEIKWLEAAILQIPSVVSQTSTFTDVIAPPHDGLVASTPDEWLDCLTQLVTMPERRAAIGASARRKALERYSLKQTGRDLRSAVSARPSEERRKTKPQILICHVFFAPQTHGGATRVVEQNVDYFIDHYLKEFEISIFTTDEGMPAGRFRIDQYRGCTVYRLATPLERNGDWRPFNEDHRPVARRVLELVRPDLVHFHCIQRLTATIVDEVAKQRIPYIVTVHDTWWISDYQFLIDQDGMAVDLERESFAGKLPQEVSRPQSIERNVRLKSLLTDAQKTLAVSRPFADLHERAGISNVVAVANGVPNLPPAVASCSAPGKLVLGHFGGRSEHKGAGLIEIVLRNNAFRNLELLMIDGRLAEGVAHWARWGATDVCLLKNVPQSEINELYAKIDVLLAPSIWPESYGLVTREAHHYGKWVVASNLGAIGDDIEEGVNGFTIDPSDASDLQALLALMNQRVADFKTPPKVTKSPRHADDQARELAILYKTLCKGSGVLQAYSTVERR